MPTALVIMTRIPVPGRTKTRMMPAMSGEQCCELQWAMLKDLGRVLEYINMPRKIFYTDDGSPEKLKKILGPGEYRPQEGGGLGSRIAAAVDYCLKQGFGRAVVIGSDYPLLQPGNIRAAIDAIEYSDVVIGPAGDGGYYLLATKKIHPEIFANKPWGTPEVLDDTLRSLQKSGLTYHLLEAGQDLDTFEDIRLCYQQLKEKRAEIRIFPRNTYEFIKKAACMEG